MSPARMTTITFLLLSYLVIFANDWAVISCRQYDSNALWKILTVPGIHVELDEAM